MTPAFRTPPVLKVNVTMIAHHSGVLHIKIKLIFSKVTLIFKNGGKNLSILTYIEL